MYFSNCNKDVCVCVCVCNPFLNFNLILFYSHIDQSLHMVGFFFFYNFLIHFFNF